MKKYIALFTIIFLAANMFFINSAVAESGSSAPPVFSGHTYDNGVGLNGVKIKVFRNGTLMTTVISKNESNNSPGFWNVGGDCPEWPTGIYVFKAVYKPGGQAVLTGEATVTRTNCDPITGIVINMAPQN